MAQSGVSFFLDACATSNHQSLLVPCIFLPLYNLDLNLAGHSPSKPTLYRCAEASWPLIGSLILASRLFIPISMTRDQEGCVSWTKDDASNSSIYFRSEDKDLGIEFRGGGGGGEFQPQFRCQSQFSINWDKRCDAEREERVRESESEGVCVVGARE